MGYRDSQEKKGDIMQHLPCLEEAKILVIGDVMLDSYWMGPVSRISPEAPVPILNIGDSKKRLGGAANVALNIDSLGAEVHLLGLMGQDEQGRYFQACLDETSIQSHIISCQGQSTINKLRIISQNQQLIRVDVDNNFTTVCKKAMMAKYDELLDTVDVVILSDYNKGTLSDTASLINKAKSKGKPVLVDPKGLDFKKYAGATLLKPNMAEFVAVAGQCDSEDIFHERAQSFLDELSLEALLVTRGSLGMALFQSTAPLFNLKANAREVFDVTGAGDTVIAVLGTSIAAGLTLPQAMTLANHAAGIVVGHLGASCVTVPELKAAIGVHERLSYTRFKVMLEKHTVSEDKLKLMYCHDTNIDATLLQSIKQYKAQGHHIYVLLNRALDQNSLEALYDVYDSMPFVDELVLATQAEANACLHHEMLSMPTQA